MKKKKITITIDDIHRNPWFDGTYRWDTVSIEKISEKILPDDACNAFSNYLEDFGIENDWINTEYMGFLTLHCLGTLSDEDLVIGINNALKAILKF